jgi:transcriptional regulator with XRE-family HTH domain
MKKYSDEELELINIQIGCTFRLERLKRGISQHDLSLDVNTDPTTIGRIERFEHGIRWEKIYQLSQYYNLNFCDLFIFKDNEYLLQIIKQCYQLETKLNQKKVKFYEQLLNDVKEKLIELKGQI